MSFARSEPIRITRKDEPDIDAEALTAIAKHPKVVAIGEAGLDYHYDKSPRERRRRVCANTLRRRAKPGCRW